MNLTPNFHLWEVAVGGVVALCVLIAMPWSPTIVLAGFTVIAITSAIRAKQWPAAIAVIFGLGLFHLYATPILPTELSGAVEGFAAGVGR